ncbi:DUF2968 domain-containing protein [Frateuria defendens]|uniref:DUF2968 domain-containing protein n=1 Tax=Frateuria defendens TaxID=2219559 RepID=UPI0009E2769B|nr:DUF2968 domain-containing protein [Frateuria defendens]
MPALAAAAPAKHAPKAPPPAATPAPAPEAPPPRGTADASTVDELRKLMDAHQLTEQRTTCNGSYGASLLFHADKLSYYVVLFHEKEFWRVIHTDSANDAKSIYRAFGTQTEKLAQVDIEAARLQAGKRYTDHLIALNEERLRSLQQDATHQQEQARQVVALQQQAQQQAVSLSSDLRNSSAQLDAMQQRIRALEMQQTNLDLTLPPPAAKSDAAAAAIAPSAAASSP